MPDMQIPTGLMGAPQQPPGLPAWMTKANQQQNLGNGGASPWYIDPNNAMENNQGYANLINTGVSGVTAQTDQSKLQGYGQQFASTFKQMTGKDPTADDYNSFYNNIVQNNIVGGGKGINGTNYADVQNLINPFLQNTFGSQIQGYQQQQQQQQLQSTEKQAQDLINQQNQATIQNLTSPAVMEQFKGGMNQTGMLNSGAFSTQLADRLAQGANANQSAALGSVGLPQIGGQAATAGQPYQQFMGNMNSNLQNFGQGATNQYDFTQQQGLAQQLQHEMDPSKLQEWSPIISGGLQAAGQAAASKSAICEALIREGLATREEYNRLHWKVLPSLFTRCRALHVYAKNGDALVRAAYRKGFDWSKAKTWFIDEPIAAKTATQAIEIYSRSCKKLCALVAPELWDERVLHPKRLDFFKFIVPVLMVPGYRRCYKELFHQHFKGVQYA